MSTTRCPAFPSTTRSAGHRGTLRPINRPNSIAPPFDMALEATVATLVSPARLILSFVCSSGLPRQIAVLPTQYSFTGAGRLTPRPGQFGTYQSSSMSRHSSTSAFNSLRTPQSPLRMGFKAKQPKGYQEPARSAVLEDFRLTKMTKRWLLKVS